MKNRLINKILSAALMCALAFISTISYVPAVESLC